MKSPIKSIGLFISTKGKRIIFKNSTSMRNESIGRYPLYTTIKVYVPDTLCDAARILTKIVG